MPSFSKSIPVVLLVVASVLAGPISRGDQNTNDEPKCIHFEECRLDGFNFCELVTDLKKSLEDPNYCPDGMTRDQFLKDGSKCWNVMHPEDPLDPSNGVPHGGIPGPGLPGTPSRPGLGLRPLSFGPGPAQRPQECTLSDDFDLFDLPLEEYLKPGSDYCPTGMARPDFERYARTCWNAMHPDHPKDGDNCNGHLDLCPLLRCGPDGLPLRGPQPQPPMQHPDPSQGGEHCELDGICDLLHDGSSGTPLDPSQHAGQPSSDDQPPASWSWWWGTPSSGPKSPYDDPLAIDSLPLLGGDNNNNNKNGDKIDLSLTHASSDSNDRSPFDPSRPRIGTTDPNDFSGDGDNKGSAGPSRKTSPSGASGDDADYKLDASFRDGKSSPLDGQSRPIDESSSPSGASRKQASGPSDNSKLDASLEDSRHGGPSDPNHNGVEDSKQAPGSDGQRIDVTVGQDGQHDGHDDKHDIEVNREGLQVDNGKDNEKGSEGDGKSSPDGQSRPSGDDDKFGALHSGDSKASGSSDGSKHGSSGPFVDASLEGSRHGEQSGPSDPSRNGVEDSKQAPSSDCKRIGVTLGNNHNQDGRDDKHDGKDDGKGSEGDCETK
ncbi:hypothetical protein BT96DRAFT_920598 [Gymnopus androsaceus JB14]|uniref:Uncharacterized protein n=1 Tax=Gymnopus androsaceus JB14 TaxID=1447944 RepID=A0A6A4HP80_9AGAR|nr:hypothetical protein BT96DRAFT_920598 [Gymnopus androsaceus JB14]